MHAQRDLVVQGMIHYITWKLLDYTADTGSSIEEIWLAVSLKMHGPFVPLADFAFSDEDLNGVDDDDNTVNTHDW